MKFEWDTRKARVNLRNPANSGDEDRYLTFGFSALNRLLVVFHTYRPGSIRIISAREATRSERKIYEEEN